MVVDSSALLSLVYSEPDADSFKQKMDAASVLRISAVSLVESCVSVLWRRGEAAVGELQELLRALNLEVVPVEAVQAGLAVDAYVRFGKGRHPANLNMGDCFSYALSRHIGEPLLFKGGDFGQTDIPVA